ncbi:hypothetical protein ACO1O0_003871 [Amphichorda felina]
MATAKQKPKSRPGRSNSLQRMLELEKQSMLERQTLHTAADLATHVRPDSAKNTANPTPSSPASPSFRRNPMISSRKPLQPQARTAIPCRQMVPDSLSLAPKAANRRTTKPPGEDHASMRDSQRQGKMQHLYELPPINTGITANLPSSDLFGASPASPYSDRSRAHHRREAKKEPGVPGLKIGTKPHTITSENGPKLAAPAGPAQPHSTRPTLVEDRQSMCQSPSWEAYGRRKKEKKEKEQADKAKGKKRRLSKAPPPTSLTSSIPTSTLHSQPPLSGKAANQPPQSRKGLAQLHNDACMSDTALSRPRQPKERPASALGLPNTNVSLSDNIPTPHTPRGRSSSFTSLFKAPFEHRRSSFDHGSDGFIGGIKLEQHRLAAHQRALDEYAIGPDSEIHPAFRKAERRSPSPLRFFVPRSEPKDAHDRAYPPIAIRTSAKNLALLGPETSTMPEGGVMNRWRARVGLKGSGQKAAAQGGVVRDARGKTGQKLTKTPSAQREESSNKMTSGRNISTQAISSPIMIMKMDGPTGSEKDELAAPKVDHSTHPALLDGAQYDEKPPQGTDSDRKNTDEAHNPASETNGPPPYTTAPLPPPPPPRRSSKRKSLIVMDDASVAYSPPTQPQLTPEPEESEGQKESKIEAPESTQPTVKASAPECDPLVVRRRQPTANTRPSSMVRPKRWSMSNMTNPPSISYDSLTPSSAIGAPAQPKRTLKAAAKAAFGRRDLPPTSIPTTKNNTSPATGPSGKQDKITGVQDWKISHPISTSPPTHSSDDSLSDDLRSASEHGTPDTSRPQSARGVFPKFGDHDGEGKNARHHSGYTSVLPSPAFSHTDDVHHANQPSHFELDPIQAAALKVMAAFPDVPVRRPDSDRRSNSDSNVAPDKTVHPRAQYRDRNRPRPITTAIESTQGTERTEPKSPPPLRDLLMSTNESSVAAPWPATYLEAARKASPLGAQVPKGLKLQNSPSLTMTPKELSPSLRTRFSFTSDSMGKAPGQRPQSMVSSADSEGTAKMFLECCGCRYYHDMPSKLYEAMTNPKGVVRMGENMEFAGAVSMTVKCPWCKHEMSTKCCAGLAAMVYVKERLH